MKTDGIGASVTAGLYIHVPFCVSKCGYCDFYSLAQQSSALQRRYVNALLNEMRYMQERFIQNTPIDTVYIGGGTPTALPAPFLEEILTALHRFALTPEVEFTVEANPGTLTPQKLAVLSKGGVNRLSLGLQARQDSLLKTLGRIHTASDFIHNFQAAREAGFHNIGVDLMFALPGQTMADWHESLLFAVSLGAEHISAYSLTPEEGTPLDRQLQDGALTLPTDETDREMYALCRQYLTAQGYTHYELSNFAKPGYESRHNTRYWERKCYYGFGPGAHTFNGGARYGNVSDLTRYIEAAHLSDIWEDYQVLTKADAMSETMFLGLRLLDGVSSECFKATFDVTPNEMYGNEIILLVEKGLLCYTNGKYQLTRLGLDLANQVFSAFV